MAPNVLDAVLEKDIRKAVKKYKVPDFNSKDNFSEWERDFKKYSGELMVWPSGYAGIFEQSYCILGFEELMLYMATDHKLVEELMDKVTDYKVEVAKRLVKIGFKMAHVGDDLGTQEGVLFNEDMFKKIYLPRLKRNLKDFTNANIPIMMHSCGNITKYIPYLIDAGVTILEPCQPCMDLNYIKREFGKDLIFYGGIDTQKLPFISEEETKEMVRSTIRILGKGGGYIIAPSQEIMNDVPLENIKVMVETIKEEREKVLNI